MIRHQASSILLSVTLMSAGCLALGACALDEGEVTDEGASDADDDVELDEIAAEITGCWFEVFEPWSENGHEVYWSEMSCRSPRRLHLTQYAQRWSAGIGWVQVAAKDWGIRYFGHCENFDCYDEPQQLLRLDHDCSQTGYFRQRIKARNPETGNTWMEHSESVRFGCVN